MADRFRPINRDTPHLFPPTVQDYLSDAYSATQFGVMTAARGHNRHSVYGDKGTKID